LLYLSDDFLSPNQDHRIDVRFWPGVWFKGVSGRPGRDQTAYGVEPASREEIMMVLQNVEHLLIRQVHAHNIFCLDLNNEVIICFFVLSLSLIEPNMRLRPQ